MNAIIRTAATVVALLALAGCAGMEYEEAEMSSAPGNAYQRDLHDEYVRLSKSEFDQGDYTDSDNYAEKALALSSGEHVQPEMIAARDLQSDRSDARRVGKECGGTGSLRWSPDHYKKK